MGSEPQGEVLNSEGTARLLYLNCSLARPLPLGVVSSAFCCSCCVANQDLSCARTDKVVIELPCAAVLQKSGSVECAQSCFDVHYKRVNWKQGKIDSSPTRQQAWVPPTDACTQGIATTTAAAYFLTFLSGKLP